MSKKNQDIEKVLKILFVEDVTSDAELIWREIKRNKISFSKKLVDNKEDYLQGLQEFEPDLIISDYSLPQFDGMKALLLRNELVPMTPFVLVTGSINEEVAVECMKSGADDYILKDNLSRLGSAILNAIDKYKLLKEKKVSEDELLKSQSRLQKAQAIAHIGNWELDLSSRMVWCSEEAIRIYGFDKASREFPLDLVQKSPLPEFRPVLDEAFDRLLKYCEPYEAEFNIKRRNDNAIRSIYSKAELVRSKDSDKVKVVGVIQDITDRKQVKEALNESENRYRRIFENVQDVYYETSIDGIILDVSPSIGIMSGGQYHRDDLKGMSMNDFYSDTYTRQTILESLRNSGSVNDFEIMLRNRDHSLIQCSISARISHDANGRPEKIIGSMRDITSRKLAEEALKKSEMRFKQIAEFSGEWIWEVDKSGLYSYCSPIIKEILGYEPEEIINKKYFYDFFIPEVREELKQAALDVFGRKENFRNFINSNLHKNGAEVILSTSGIPVLDGAGNLLGYRGVDTDITESRRAEEELKNSYIFNESLLRTIPFGMDIIDEFGNILFLSINFKRIFGEDAIGKKCWELYRDDNTQCIDCPLTHGIIVGETEVYESHGIIGNRIFEINHTGMVYKGKKAMLEIFQDITERKENEKELIKAKEKAEESDRLKTAFLHNISHEIRTPMNAIVGFSALLAEPDIDAQSRQSYTDVIMQSSSHLLSIITDIVDISNIEANLVKVLKNEVNLNFSLKKIYNQFIISADEKRLGFIYQTDLADSDAAIVTDITKVVQIISNLINNAFKFTSSGYVKFGYVVQNNFLEFFVSDTGIGIPPEHHLRVFDRFYQVENEKSRLFEGTGLGLAISKAYVELLGGRIWLESETGTPETGTTFFFTIPFEKPVKENLPDKEKLGVEGFVFPEKKTILVAEDIDSNFKLITYFLAKTNTTIVRARNGKEAVEKALSTMHIDLILMDIKMPLMDGYTAVKIIREKNSVIPIIAQTAYAEDKEKAIECGCSAFISKPFDKKSLIKIIREFI
jgi:PAS domain S-box-containing protein